MGIAVVAPVAAASSYLGAPPRAAAAAGRAPARAQVAAAGMSSRASSFVGCGLAVAAASIAARPRRTGSGGGGALGCKCLFGLGVPELAVIAGVAALVFGPKQLPEIGRNIGKTVKSFQQVRIGA
jgi:sec-independent protein translocase protein TatA